MIYIFLSVHAELNFFVLVRKKFLRAELENIVISQYFKDLFVIISYLRKKIVHIIKLSTKKNANTCEQMP